LGKCNIARNKFYKSKNGTKISFITDKFGIPLSILFNSGNVHDLTFISGHVDDLSKFNNLQTNTKIHLLGDKGYVSKVHRSFLEQNNIILVVPKKKNSHIDYYFDAELYKNRITIEHSFQKLKRFKRIQLRYDSNMDTYESFVYCAVILMYSSP